jgi:hypothetical protein
VNRLRKLPGWETHRRLSHVPQPGSLRSRFDSAWRPRFGTVTFMIREMGGRGRSGAAFCCNEWFGTMIYACVSQLAAFAETTMHDPFTDGARDVLMFANHEAVRYGHEYIGTEHLLLGLAADNEGVAGRVFKELGLRPETIRTELEKIVLPLTPGNVFLLSTSSRGTLTLPVLRSRCTLGVRFWQSTALRRAPIAASVGVRLLPCGDAPGQLF